MDQKYFSSIVPIHGLLPKTTTFITGFTTFAWSGHCTYKWSAGRTGECDFRWLSGDVFPPFIGWSRLATTRHWSADHAKYAAILFRISSADFSGRSADNRILSGLRLHACGTNESYVDLSRYRSSTGF